MLWTLVKKELRRVFTDRRLVFSTFILPALSIYVLYSLMGTMIGDRLDDRDEHPSMVTVYHGPETFKAYYQQVEDVYGMDLTYSEGPIDVAKEGLKYGDTDLVIVFDELFDSKVTNYEVASTQATISTFYNPSEDYSAAARRKFVYELLSDYESELLIERFGDASYATAFGIDTANEDNQIMDEAKATGTGLSMILPMLIAVLLFAGAMGIGLDTIAGEKERGTMATLLMTPVKRETIALGKVIGLSIIAIISATTSFIAIIASLPNSGMMFTGGDVSITSLQFTPLMYVQLLVVMLTLVGVYVGLICITSVRAKSVKEAGTYISPIYMLVMFASFSTMFQTGDPALYQFAIPVLGNVLAIKRLFTFDLLMSEFLLTSSVSIAVAGILIYMITRSFNNEKVMLNA